MNADPDFVEVRASHNVFSRGFAEKRRLIIPHTWTVNPTSSFVTLSPFIIMGTSTIGIFDFFLGMIPSSMICFIICGATAIIARNRKSTTLMLGPGRISISRQGFTDDRVGKHIVEWGAIDRSQAAILPRTGTLLGVQLWLKPGSVHPVTSPAYDKAYLFHHSPTRPDLFIDHKGVSDGRQIAEAIHILIDSSMRERRDADGARK